MLLVKNLGELGLSFLMEWKLQKFVITQITIRKNSKGLLAMREIKMLALEAALFTDFCEDSELLLENAEEIYQWLIDEDR